MPAPRSFDTDLAAIDAVTDLPAPEALPIVRLALTNKSNLIVSRAAKHTLRLDLKQLIPDLVEAFHRFMPPADAVKTDPQCWAKNELSKTLASFELQDSDLFLSGLHHHQYEPNWGGTTDTAGALRGTCASPSCSAATSPRPSSSATSHPSSQTPTFPSASTPPAPSSRWAPTPPPCSSASAPN